MNQNNNKSNWLEEQKKLKSQLSILLNQSKVPKENKDEDNDTKLDANKGVNANLYSYENVNENREIPIDNNSDQLTAENENLDENNDAQNEIQLEENSEVELKNKTDESESPVIKNIAPKRILKPKEKSTLPADEQNNENDPTLGKQPLFAPKVINGNELNEQSHNDNEHTLSVYNNDLSTPFETSEQGTEHTQTYNITNPETVEPETISMPEQPEQPERFDQPEDQLSMSNYEPQSVPEIVDDAHSNPETVEPEIVSIPEQPEQPDQPEEQLSIPNDESQRVPEIVDDAYSNSETVEPETISMPEQPERLDQPEEQLSMSNDEPQSVPDNEETRLEMGNENNNDLNLIDGDQREYMKERQNISRMISQNFMIIEKIPEYVNITDEKELLNNALKALEDNKLDDANTYLQEATNKINLIYNQLISALKILKSTKNRIVEVKSKGKDVSMVTKIFTQAKTALKNNDFKNAVAYGNLCGILLNKIQ